MKWHKKCLYIVLQRMSSQNNCVVVCVNVLACGQVDVISTQNSCSVVCVNVLACGQVEVSRDTNLDFFVVDLTQLSYIIDDFRQFLVVWTCLKIK